MTKEIEVLIIEDDARIAEIHRRFLDKIGGFQVIGIATTKAEATDFFTIFTPPLILLDVYFPDMNGVDFLSLIKQTTPKSHVIMITAAKEGTTISKALSLGVYDYIVKPVLFQRFQETLLNFRTYYLKLQHLQQESAPLTQPDVDALLNRREQSFSTIEQILPKGIDKLTLDKIKTLMNDSSQSYNAEDVGALCGVSRTTARRYLEYLVSSNTIHADLVYGVVGRPERIYTNKKLLSIHKG